MSITPPEKHSTHDLDAPSSLDSLEPDMSGAKKCFLFLLVLVIMAALSWVILQYAVFAPKQAAELEAKLEREKAAKIAADKEELRILAIQQNKIRKAEIARKQKLEQQRIAMFNEQKRQKRIKQNIIAYQAAIKAKNWKVAESYLGELQDDRYNVIELAKLQTRIDQGKDAERKVLIKVNGLLDQAKRLDVGKYSEEAIQLLDEALQLYPMHAESSALKKKIEAYTNEFRIPEDAKTISEILPKLRAGDTIILAKGLYKAPTIFTTPVHIKGAGIGQSIIECDTTMHSAFVFQGGNKEKPYTLSGATIRGSTYQDFNIDRYPLVLIKGHVVIDKVTVEMSSGHGIAILSGKLTLTHSEITANAWDGISIKGSGAQAEIRKCKIHTNYDHGIDFWENAKGSITDCEIYENSGSGIVIMGEKAYALIEQVRSYRNEQCGIVATAKGSMTLERVVTASNRLSGVVVQGKETKAKFGMVVSNNNQEAGYYIDPASTVKGYENTTAEGNTKGRLVRKALRFSIERQDR